MQRREGRKIEEALLLKLLIAEILQLLNSAQLLDSNPVLQRSIQVRNPYVDPLNVLQAELLRRYRAQPSEALHDGLLLTIHGIAAGMRNTG